MSEPREQPVREPETKCTWAEGGVHCGHSPCCQCASPKPQPARHTASCEWYAERGWSCSSECPTLPEPQLALCSECWNPRDEHGGPLYAHRYVAPQPEAEALAREIGEAVAVTVYNSGDFDVDAAPAIPLIAAFLRRHDEAKEDQPVNGSVEWWKQTCEYWHAQATAARDRAEGLIDGYEAMSALANRLEGEAAALREIHAQSGQELLDFSQENAALRERVKQMEVALVELRVNANRLCDRNQGGSYEADCRRSIALVDSVLLAAYRASQGEPKP